MPRPSTPLAAPSVAAALAADRLGVPAVVFFVMSAATPLTVVAGVVTTGYATTGLIGIPVAFLAVAAVLALFSVGYVAMARRVANAGAFYSYIARGVGRPAGVGAAWVALASYNLLQVGLYGAIGAAVAPLLDQWTGVDVVWWLIALVAWAVTATMGLARVDVNGRVLSVLLLAEVAIIVVYSLTSLAHPADGKWNVAALSPSNLAGPGVGALLVLAVLGFIGFEAAVVFAEETRDPKRTVATATFIAVGVTAALYTLSSWAMTVAVGPEHIVDRSASEGPDLLFDSAGAHLGATMATAGRVLFATSILAAMIAFHNTTARYMFALGRERVLPATLARTTLRGGTPLHASLLQSGIGLTAIIGYASVGSDPLVHLFYWAGTSGGIGILLLITTTAIAVPLFLARQPPGAPRDSLWRRLVAPLIALAALLIITTLAVGNIDVLLGIAPGHRLTWAVPVGFLAIGAAGTGWGWWLRAHRPEVYAVIGLGAHAAVPPPAVPRTVAHDAGLRAGARR
ncbi:APC family permease [Micromonospora sp. DT233]|uniref:APC family permease n=1 Tax=Micromonospora sp. DT233 TaxID=3393432 RepID=UPI003CE915A3